MCFVPLTERSAVNDNNAVLHKGLGTDKLVVTGIVHYIHNTGLAGLAWRGKVIINYL